MSKYNVDKTIALSDSPDLLTEENDVNGKRQTTFTAHRAASPAIGLRYSLRSPASSTLKHAARSLLPDVTRISFRLPWFRYHLYVNLDCRTLGEDILLLGALILALSNFNELKTKKHIWLFTGE